MRSPNEEALISEHSEGAAGQEARNVIDWWTLKLFLN